MENLRSFFDLNDDELKSLIKDKNIDKIQLIPGQRRKIFVKMFDKDFMFTEEEKSILLLYIGMMDFKQHSTYTIAKDLNKSEEKIRFIIKKCIGEIFPKCLKNKNIYDINIWYNFDINYEVLSKAQLTPLQYNVLILFFKYKICPKDIEIYYRLSSLANIFLNIKKQYKNIFISKESKTMDNITTRPELNITRSNRHILNGVTKENFDKFYELVVSHLSKDDLKTFHTIIEGKTKVSELLHIRNYETVRKSINDVLQSDFLATDTKPENEVVKIPEQVPQTEVENNATTFEEPKDLTPKFLYILTHNVKIKKEKLSTLCECYDSGNVYMLDKKLDKIISKHKNKNASKK